MRIVSLLVLSVALLIPTLAYAADGSLDLRQAAVVVPSELRPTEKKALDMLLNEVETRTQITFPVVKALPDNQPAIVIGTAQSLGQFANDQHIQLDLRNNAPEGFHLWSPDQSQISNFKSQILLIGSHRIHRRRRSIVRRT